jgi:putative tricarboxylic transport membrane protein
MPGQKFGPAWFPGLIAVGLILCGGGLVLRSRGQTWLVMPGWLRRTRPVLGVLSVLLGLLFYVIAADKLGFYLTALLLLTVWMRVLGAAWRLTIPVAIIATVVIHLSFYKLLRIPLPWGLFERYAF